MSMDFSDFAKGLKEFRAFFTTKHITVLLLVAVALVLLLAPNRQDTSPTVAGEKAACSDASCPMPDAMIIAPIVLTEVAQENWQFDLPGEGWEADEPSVPDIKVVERNNAQECMVFMVKEPTEDSFGAYVISTIRSFTSDNGRVGAIKQVVINDNQFVMVQFLNGGEVVWIWLAVKDGFGYGLACGCDINVDAGSSQHDLCVEVADSLEIK